MQLMAVSNDSQPFLPDRLFYFKSKNEFILEICQVLHLEKKSLVTVRVFIKKQITKPFFRRNIFAYRQ